MQCKCNGSKNAQWTSIMRNQESMQCKSHRLLLIVMSIESSKLQAVMSYDVALRRKKSVKEMYNGQHLCYKAVIRIKNHDASYVQV